MIRGIRGATTVNFNTSCEIEAETEKLLKEMVAMNKVNAEDVAQVIMTATEDIDASFPAKAMRRLAGWDYVPVMCAREIAVKGSLALCIRVMMTVNTESQQHHIHHVFLNQATALRPDLVKSAGSSDG